MKKKTNDENSNFDIGKITIDFIKNNKDYLMLLRLRNLKEDLNQTNSRKTFYLYLSFLFLTFGFASFF